MTDAKRPPSPERAAAGHLLRHLKVAAVCFAAVALWFVGTLAGIAVTQSTVWGSVIGAAVAFGGFLAYRQWRFKTVFALKDAPKDVPPRFLAALLVALVMAWLAGQVTAMWLYGIVPGAKEAFDAHNEALSSVPLAAVFFLSLIAAPLGEEALMRGTVYPELRRVWGIVPAAVIASLVFSLLHGNVVQIASTFLLAMVLSFAYEFTGRLLVPVSMHFLFNLGALVVPAEFVIGIAGPVTAGALAIGSALSIAWLMREGEVNRAAGVL